MRKKVSNTLLVSCFLMLCLCGCKKKQEPPPNPAPKPAPAPVQKPVQKQASSAKTAQGGVPQFDVSKMKDPFKPYVFEPPKLVTPKARVRADALPIERYDTGMFKVSGIVVGLKENSALVVDPSGKGYVVKPGMSIGSNSGRIMKITASGIEVVERYVEDSGRAKKRTVWLTLPQKK